MTKDDKGYQINLEVKNKMDYISYMFHISELGMPPEYHQHKPPCYFILRKS